jgi:pimeloyl-ACP methyl ester carboxylesterase
VKNLYKHGKPPYSVVVVHGGPGARGEMKPVARKLAKKYGVLEPLQDANTIKGQIYELLSMIKKYGTIPITLIGHSWGAWLCYIFTACHASLVKKLILISSGPFEQKYAAAIMQNRLKRLNQTEKKELNIYFALMNNQKIRAQETKSLIKRSGQHFEFVKFGALISKTDSYQPIPSRHRVELRLDIMQGIWPQAEKLRKSGKLLGLADRIKCPVTALHGDYDPHPWQGVKNPLLRKLPNFRFLLFKKCGHTPWLEKYAQDWFYQILKKEMTRASIPC